MLADPVMLELIRAASAIDPVIDLGLLAESEFWMNLDNRLRPGAAYYTLCERAGSTPFTDIVLLPPSGPPSLLRHIRAVMESIRALEPESRILVLSWGKREDGTPAEAIFDDAEPVMVYADLYKIEPCLWDGEVETVIVKALQSLGGAARVHLVPATATMAFFSKFQGIFMDRRVICYRFPDAVGMLGAYQMTTGAVFEFLSTCFEGFTAIIASDQATIRADRERLAIEPERWHELPPPCDAASADPRPISGRVLCLPQDEADFVGEVSKRLAGWPAMGEPAQKITLDAPQDWRELEEIDLAMYDAILCMDACGPALAWITRALGAGVPVVAPKESMADAVIVDGVTWLLFDTAPDDAGTGETSRGKLCADTVRRLYAGPSPLAAMRSAAYAFGQTHYSTPVFRQKLHSILEVVG